MTNHEYSEIVNKLTTKNRNPSINLVNDYNLRRLRVLAQAAQVGLGANHGS